MSKETPSIENAFGDRQLAAILFTDVSGFSRLVEQNETRTLMLVKRDLDLIARACREFGGEMLKNTGDGCLATFRSVDAAVRTALRIQKSISDASHRLPPEQVLHHRIGIHLGDVFLGKGDALGNGVNIAARLMNEAEPDGICVSQAVYDVVKHRLGVKAICIGARELKNIREAMPVYRLLLSAAAREQEHAPEATPAPAQRRKILVPVVLAGVIVIAALTTWLVIHSRTTTASSPTTLPASATEVSIDPSDFLQIIRTAPTISADSPDAWATFPKFTNANISCGFDKDVYSVTIVNDTYRQGMVTVPWAPLSDATVLVTGRSKGSGSGWGIMIVAVEGPRRLARVSVSQIGIARVDLSRINGADENNRALNPGNWTDFTDPFINRGEGSNTVVLGILGTTIRVFANGHPLGTDFDISPLGRTQITLGAEGYKDTRAEFTELRLWRPKSSTAPSK